MISADMLPGERSSTSEPAAPPLPIEGHVVAAALAAREAYDACKSIILLLQYSPRAEEAVVAEFQSAQEKLSTAWRAYAGYREVMNCKGQA